MKDSDKIKSLQAIRGLAFLGIFLKHTGITIFCSLGDWGVSIFFILSGFLMTVRYINSDLCSGGLKYGYFKVKKLLPLYYVMMIVSIPYFLSELYKNDSSVFEGILQFISNALLIQAWIPDESFYFSLNGISWFLSVMFFLYSVFPYILNKIRKITDIKKTYFMIIFIYAVQVLVAFTFNQVEIIHKILPDFHTWFSYILPLYRLGDFMIGCILGFIFLNRDVKEDIVNGTIQELISIIYILVLIIIQTILFSTGALEKLTYMQSWWINTIYFEISSVFFIYIFASERGVISLGLRKSFLVMLGNISSITYLIHLDCIKYLESFFRLKGLEVHGKVLLLIIALPLTIVISFVWIRIYNKCIWYKNKLLEVNKDDNGK